MSVFKPLSIVSDAEEIHQMIDALMGGTKAMREMGERYLPKWPSEDKEDYDFRLSVATLLPAYRETMANSTGRVFFEPIELQDDVPEQIAKWCENIDAQGNRIDVWAQRYFCSGLTHGLAFCLVDKPRGDNVKTKADEKKQGLRPYTVLLHKQQVIGWKSAQSEDGMKLTQLRIREKVEESDGEYGVKFVDQIKLFKLENGTCTVEIWRKDEAGAEFLHEGPMNTGMKSIPLVVFYTHQLGFMHASPALLDLAYMNIEHWQSKSDQQSITHVARVPLLGLIGFDEDSPIVIGKQALKIPMGGDAKYVEHSGKAIEAGRVSILDLEEQMKKAGAKLLEKDTSAAKTATQSDNEKLEDLCALATMAISFEDAMNNILQLMAEWMGLPDGGHCTVNSNFQPDEEEINPQLVTSIVAAWQGNALRKKDVIRTFQKIGLIDDSEDVEDVLSELEAETPGLTLSMVTNNAKNNAGSSDITAESAGAGESGGAV